VARVFADAATLCQDSTDRHVWTARIGTAIRTPERPRPRSAPVEDVALPTDATLAL